jgi:exodeoxyribonuclease VII small subunit
VQSQRWSKPRKLANIGVSAVGASPGRGVVWRAVISASVKLPAVGELSFEGALKELEAIVARLEQGEVELEDSIALYERGQALKAHCEARLKSAEGRLEKIVMGEDGPAIGERMTDA